MHVCVLNHVQLFCNPSGSSVHGISQARTLEWVVISFSRGSSQSRDRIHVSCIGRLLYCWETHHRNNKYKNTEETHSSTPAWEVHRWERLVSYSPWSGKESNLTLETQQQFLALAFLPPYPRLVSFCLLFTICFVLPAYFIPPAKKEKEKKKTQREKVFFFNTEYILNADITFLH